MPQRLSATFAPLVFLNRNGGMVDLSLVAVGIVSPRIVLQRCSIQSAAKIRHVGLRKLGDLSAVGQLLQRTWEVIMKSTGKTENVQQAIKNLSCLERKGNFM